MRLELKRRSLSQAAVALACVGGLCSSAAMADEHVLILLDRTGSMGSTSVPGLTRLQVAKARIDGYLQIIPSVTTKYAFWTFENAGPTQVFSFADNKTPAQISAAVNAVTLGGNTPLAGSVCAAVDALINYLPNQLHTKRIYLVTDGDENATASLDQCYGPWSAGVWPNLTVGSWQEKVRNKACTGSATSAGPCGIFPAPYPPGLTLIADIDFLFEDYVPLQGEAQAREPDDAAKTVMGPYQVGASAAAEVPFFNGLAQATHGRYASITQKTPPAQATPLPGDANLDGCVNVADRTKVLAEYGTKVPTGTGSDFNRNGTVDTGDYQTVLNNFGRGCTTLRE
ncbi:VWA domain-containing protein [Corallococcus carmarthensis]|uniref:VWA domain-containing protein n=1 Tax=Corallococcus carmarthensis TaxID=2316728 RepID=A0A3A8K9Y0_9BACT|nr:VWA domain-containing protein [Corallococcus carmarthensis]NOK18899.1 VWA domain-containing protein [Corallococcus carmarthensis]RKH04137.1 VWA domain-containing protein [Corallococcus carmarthensis]